MPRRPLIWPFAGRADEAAHSDQPNYTTRQAKNVRNRDPVSGRLSGATRSGMVKWNETVIGSTRIKALASTAIDSRTTEYSYSSGAVSTAWSRNTPSMTSSLAGAVDRQGNVYALDGGAGIVKFNSAGKQLYKISLPVADPGHIVRALWVDEADRIFAGVSEGGDVATAAVWCVLQLQDNEYSVLWTLTPGAYTEALKVYRGSQLFAAHNYPQENRARVVVYEGLGLEPREESRIESVAYPVHGMDVLDGAVYCAASETEASDATAHLFGGSTDAAANYRPGHPSARYYHPPIVSWTPRNLDNWERRVWSWYRAEDIDETDVEQTGDVAVLEDGQQILRWRDISGNNRHWYAGNLAITGETGPKYVRYGPGGMPALRFSNTSATDSQSLTTFPNASIGKEVADQQRTALPMHTDAMYALFMLFRPATEDAATNPRVLLYAENDAGGGASNHGLWVNRLPGAAEAGVYDAGRISFQAATDAGDPGSAAGPQPGMSDPQTHRTGLVLVTVIWDGGIDPNDTSKTRCVVRVNGATMDRFEGLAFNGLDRNYIGYAPAVAATFANKFKGELCEMLVLGRIDRYDATTEPKILTHDKYEVGVDAAAAQDNDEMARIEGYMLHNRGAGHLLGDQHQDHSGTVFGYLAPHYYGPDSSGYSSPPDEKTADRSTALAQIIQRFPLTSKHDDKGRLLWTCNEVTHPDTTTNQGGIGYAVTARKVESDDLVHVWMAGPQEALATVNGEVGVRKVIDSGSTFSGSSGDGAWRHKFTGNPTWTYFYPRMASDKFGNLYLPGHETGAGTMRALHIFAKDGSAGAAVELLAHALPAPGDEAYAVAIPPDDLTPDYRDDLTTELAEVAYVFTTAGSSPDPTESVFKLQLVSTDAVAGGSPREVVTLAVVEDDIRKVTATTSVIPTGGTAVIDATAQYVQAFRAGEDIVILDGTRVLAYKLRDGTIEVLTSTSAGEVPNRPRLGMFWRHRLVLALDGGKYSASRLGNIRDWNLNPGVNIAGQPLQTATQAFNGTLTRAGEAEDSIVAMIPVWDDLAFLVGESKILRITGDPQDGGQIHLVTDSMGGVFGDSWCKDDQGRVFLWGNKPPGLYQLRPEGDPIPLSTRTLEASEFEAIDYSTHRIVLAWDPIERGVRIWQVAWGTSTIASGWFWEERTHRLVRVPPIWQDKINAAGKQVTAYTFLGGDDTRALLIGCEDGYIRQFSSTARDDDGTAIDSLALIEVTGGLPEGERYRLREVSVTLADDQEGCRLEVFASDVADSIGPIRAGYDLFPGRNVVRSRVKGAHIWVRLRNAATGRWRFEEGSVDLVPAGRF